MQDGEETSEHETSEDVGGKEKRKTSVKRAASKSYRQGAAVSSAGVKKDAERGGEERSLSLIEGDAASDSAEKIQASSLQVSDDGWKILHLDKYLVVVEKASGLLSVPGVRAERKVGSESCDIVFLLVFELPVAWDKAPEVG